MNKIYFVAKIAVSILGMYLILCTIPMAISLVMVGALSLQTFKAWSLISMTGYGVILFGYLWLIYYVLIHRSGKFAQKVVGLGGEPPDPPNPSAWYPFAMRMVVMVAGFLFLQKAISTSSMLVSYIRFAFQSNRLEGIRQVYEYGVFFLIYLAISIYLLAGAPHFVRWQVRKTAELCKEFSEK